MIDETRSYEALMEFLHEHIPDLHRQVADSAARGRELHGKHLDRTERAGRDRLLSESKLGRIAEADVTSVPFTDSEKLDLLLGALRTSLRTRIDSQRILTELFDSLEISYRDVVFVTPETLEDRDVARYDEGEASRLDAAIRMVDRISNDLRTERSTRRGD